MNQKYTNSKSGVPLGERANSLRRILLVFLMVFAVFQLQAQDRTVSGTVTDAMTGEALPGTSVKIKGTTQGTTTSLEGEFKLQVNADDILVFLLLDIKNKKLK